MWCAPQVEVDGQAVTVLKKGSYFGEVGLLRNCRRTASIRALSETCDLFVLGKVAPRPCSHIPPRMQPALWLARWTPRHGHTIPPRTRPALCSARWSPSCLHVLCPGVTCAHAGAG